MQYTIQRLRKSDDRKQQLGAALALEKICGLSRGYSKRMVEYIITGQTRFLKIPDSASPANVATLASYFVMSEMPSKAQPHVREAKDTTQLKLWEVTYTLRGSHVDHVALVLAENESLAHQVIIKRVSTFTCVAREMEGPFENGQVLTLTRKVGFP